ncbi:uncharacterized protein Z519_02160 [Cladophialophora bantiana CBS 173.52]|uniref:Amino acid permease/ SLC12A domain-containing protein n=1 Tax=Cladophialophora bantiana (strain ATCC 10958 / CBS 173.52 / CDC B-1940 / NIH 8579) TaxID=1442370 RepID=A0A0D2IJ16_CLAB1|nr:uncharacterized protein Z519_02160 [Cladophialophora bantiana CBS 173.52]KIW96769.1 hypothetical protein Z519_02160 [Cladophialophora bantiana CBS 173.52]
MSKSMAAEEIPSEVVRDSDALHLAQLGYKQELDRNFSQWTLISFGVTLSATWVAIGGALGTGIYNGGPPGIVYGFILVFFGQCFVGATIAEFASSYPTTGGMYHWTAMLAPEKYAPTLSYITGWNTVLAYIVSVASVTCVSGQQIVALAGIAKEDLVVQRWHSFLTMELLNLVTLIMVVFFNKIFPLLNGVGLWWFLSSLVIISVTVLAMTPGFRSPHDVFVEFINNTGWSTNGMAFITGIVNPLFAISVLDSTCHISEEVPEPEKNVPKAVLYTLIAALVEGWLFMMVIFFSYQDLDLILENPWELPIAELFHQATGTRAGTFGLTFLLMVSGLWTVWNCQLSQGRIYWSFARDNAVPMSRFFSHVDSNLKVPVRAHLLCAFIVALLGLLYMWAETAFAAFISSANIFFNITYLIPLVVNIVRQRRSLVPGWFYMRRFGMLINIIAMVWLLFLIACLGLPYVMPVTPENMNYTWVIVGGGLLFEVVLFAFKRREYRGPVLKGLEVVMESEEVLDVHDSDNPKKKI